MEDHNRQLGNDAALAPASSNPEGVAREVTGEGEQAQDAGAVSLATIQAWGYKEARRRHLVCNRPPCSCKVIPVFLCNPAEGTDQPTIVLGVRHVGAKCVGELPTKQRARLPTPPGTASVAPSQTPARLALQDVARRHQRAMRPREPREDYVSAAWARNNRLVELSAPGRVETNCERDYWTNSFTLLEKNGSFRFVVDRGPWPSIEFEVRHEDVPAQSMVCIRSYLSTPRSGALYLRATATWDGRPWVRRLNLELACAPWIELEPARNNRQLRTPSTQT
jgi:hypothetical protein